MPRYLSSHTLAPERTGFQMNKNHYHQMNTSTKKKLKENTRSNLKRINRLRILKQTQKKKKIDEKMRERANGKERKDYINYICFNNLCVMNGRQRTLKIMILSFAL